MKSYKILKLVYKNYKKQKKVNIFKIMKRKYKHRLKKRQIVHEKTKKFIKEYGTSGIKGCKRHKGRGVEQLLTVDNAKLVGKLALNNVDLIGKAGNALYNLIKKRKKDIKSVQVDTPFVPNLNTMTVAERRSYLKLNNI